MLNVFLTIDTEVWQDYASLANNIESAVYGVTPGGEFGLRFLLERFKFHRLKAIFFVEPLFSWIAGKEKLSEIVSAIQGFNQEAQLHIHTEWLSKMADPLLGDTYGISIKDFSKPNQILLIKKALERLEECGAENVCAFRAGNYGANFDTLRALFENGIKYDTSHNTCYLDSTCDMKTDGLLQQPAKIHGVWEFPVNFFSDRPGHYRHVQLTACSFGEIRHVLFEAWKKRWFSLVIVLHSFELLHRRKPGSGKPPGKDYILIRRFENLCRLLADNRDKFQTMGFKDIDPHKIPVAGSREVIKSGLAFTALRHIEQLARRFQV